MFWVLRPARGKREPEALGVRPWAREVVLMSVGDADWVSKLNVAQPPPRIPTAEEERQRMAGVRLARALDAFCAAYGEGCTWRQVLPLVKQGAGDELDELEDFDTGVDDDPGEIDTGAGE